MKTEDEAMHDRLRAKTERYERLLSEAIEAADIAGGLDAENRRLAEEYLEMAEAYLADGRHFWSEEDVVTALAAFSYGHGWLDAGIRAELVDAGEDVDPIIPRGV